MSDINFEDYRDLLIVNAGGELCVVEAPAHEAEISDIVAFDRDGQEILGPVIDKMWCNRTESAVSFQRTGCRISSCKTGVYQAADHVCHFYHGKRCAQKRQTALSFCMEGYRGRHTSE